jgi:hypothetical protein
MSTEHPITPPPELVDQWRSDWEALPRQGPPLCQFEYVATCAAQWGADQELEACAEWVGRMFHGHKTWSDELRAARRPSPKPPETIEVDGFTYRLVK